MIRVEIGTKVVVIGVLSAIIGLVGFALAKDGLMTEVITVRSLGMVLGTTIVRFRTKFLVCGLIVTPIGSILDYYDIWITFPGFLSKR